MSTQTTIQSIITRYKEELHERYFKDEIYKWELLQTFKGRPNVDAEDFAKEIEELNFENLIYYMSSVVLKHIARKRPEELRTAFKELFNEEIELNKRIKSFIKETKALYRSMGEVDGHHQDERSTAAYLTYRFPETYSFYQYKFYNELCAELGIKRKKAGNIYPHYLSLLDEFVEVLQNKEAEFVAHVKSQLPGNDIINLRLLAQNILFSYFIKTEREVPEFSDLQSEYDLQVEMKDRNWNFLEAIKMFDKADLQTYFSFLKEITLHFDLKKGDERVVFNYRRSSRSLIFTVGQRYCLSMQDKGNYVKFGFISTKELSREADQFEGKKPKPWYNISNDLHLSAEEKQSVFDAIEAELNRTTTSSFRKYNKEDFETFILEGDYVTSSSNMSDQIASPLNQILYGPPGTGKTYSTIDKVVSICASNEDSENHEKNKKTYERLLKEGDVVFTTFHQSMSYEEFIEGIKPELDDETRSINYSIKPGIFKKACARAAYNCYKKDKSSVSKDIDFDVLYDAFLSFVKEGIRNKDFVICKTIQGANIEIFKTTRNDSIKARSQGSLSRSVAPLTKENIQKLYDRFDSVDEITSLQDVKETVEVRPRITEFYAVFNRLKEFEKAFKPSEDQSLEKEIAGLSDHEIVKKFEAGVFNQSVEKYAHNAQPVAIIIDEINRGNVAAIFGELITLIETDKRKGYPESITAKLPYSDQDFFVPANLHIIGTMNTADRSVEALDTALRRRFSFVEMMPRPELLWQINPHQGVIEGIDLVEVLQTMNDRIEVLVDRDHTIGHSYFMKVNNAEDLKNVFKDKVIPLLQEYFFGDYGKMEMVIGSYFFAEKTTPVTFAVQNHNYHDLPKRYLLKDLAAEDFDIVQAMHALLGKTETP